MIVTDKNFQETLDANDLILIDFWADWCGPCKRVSPILDDISDENWWKNWKERLKDVDPWLYGSAKRFGDERWICSNPNVKTYETIKNDGFYIDNDI